MQKARPLVYAHMKMQQVYTAKVGFGRPRPRLEWWLNRTQTALERLAHSRTNKAAF
jgi:hypothetical protein